VRLTHHLNHVHHILSLQASYLEQSPTATVFGAGPLKKSRYGVSRFKLTPRVIEDDVDHIEQFLTEALGVMFHGGPIVSTKEGFVGDVVEGRHKLAQGCIQYKYWSSPTLALLRLRRGRSQTRGADAHVWRGDMYSVRVELGDIDAGTYTSLQETYE
jgi:hypothetical protein